MSSYHLHFIASLTILRFEKISSAQDIRSWTEEFDIRTDSKETLSIKSACKNFHETRAFSLFRAGNAISCWNPDYLVRNQLSLTKQLHSLVKI